MFKPMHGSSDDSAFAWKAVHSSKPEFETQPWWLGGRVLAS